MSDEPLTDQSADFRALCMAIGFVVVNWTMIEQQMDICVSVLFRHCDGSRFRKNGDIPRSLSQKAKTLKDCFRQLPQLASISDEGLVLVKRVTALSPRRDDLVHGAISNLEAIDGTFHFRKVDYEKKTHVVRQFTFNPSDFSKLETSLGDLLTDLIAFSQKLAGMFPK